jgi:transcription elongation factor Elf1
MAKDAETYSTEFVCRNCDETGSIVLPKGTKLEDVPCPNCGCKTLEHYDQKRELNVGGAPLDMDERDYQQE